MTVGDSGRLGASERGSKTIVHTAQAITKMATKTTAMVWCFFNLNIRARYHRLLAPGTQNETSARNLADGNLGTKLFHPQLDRFVHLAPLMKSFGKLSTIL